MAIEFTENIGLHIIPLDEPEGWADALNGNWSILDSTHAIGGCCVKARDIDPETLLPTSLYYGYAPGFVRRGSNVGFTFGESDLLAPASATISLWLDWTLALQSGADFPTDRPFVPLADIYTDADKITEIADLRHPLPMVQTAGILARVAVTAAYTQEPGVNYIRADATAGPFSITLADPTYYRNHLIIIRKSDSSASAVTVLAPDSSIVATLAARGSVALTSTGAAYEVVF